MIDGISGREFPVAGELMLPTQSSMTNDRSAHGNSPYLSHVAPQHARDG